ncbi:MAG: energy-coupling factor transporter ATPase [Chloroflexi bacterium HGW-Chloroflexi-10]|nr:MAG: energy-coupling factor transporter ATPase [Chloroflexi bacterium HGW-Chloroflexi-10]
MANLFDVNHISYAHPIPGGEPHPALRDISFQIQQGEYIAIVGANGSGKTTLARHLNALLVPDQGTVRMQGLNTREKENHLSIHQRVGMVFQHPQEQMIATSLEEDVAFGPENLGLSTPEIKERVRTALTQVEMWDQRSRSPQHLSAGQMQRVALAGILAMRPACIIFDEATAMLDPAGREDVLHFLKDLHKDGITVITITHFMEEAALAERVFGMSQGHLLFDGSPRQLFTNPALLEEMNIDKPRVLSFAQELATWIPELNDPLTLAEFDQQLKPLPQTITMPALDIPGYTKQPDMVNALDLSFTYLRNTPLAHTALYDIDFNVTENTIHGMIGATGSGKSTLMQHLNGLYLPQNGQLKVGPFQVNENTDLLQLRRFAGIVFQNPNYQLFEQYVGDEIAYGLRLLGFAGPELRERVRHAMQWVGLDFEVFKDRMTFALSGGERRKVALASTLALDPTLLLLDEPTAGLDPVARRDILARIKSIHQQGKTIIVSSHQLEDLALLTSQITLLSEGRVVSNQASGALLSDHLLLEANQMSAPVAAHMAASLRKKGWLLPPEIIISQQLIGNFKAWGNRHV